jgi:hypothetical protein
MMFEWVVVCLRNPFTGESLIYLTSLINVSTDNDDSKEDGEAAAEQCPCAAQNS